ncbi:hypothetical protein Anapl_03611 [Anas platyrhynchos]|uniref:Uncharacterized protein n=1 Tax=Anas platyrhynchos TaxID=8839 RepID=R0KAT8_ANAPL|nr:hypothetical protein Anapl_03611 [Anas platyrhynchos]
MRTLLGVLGPTWAEVPTSHLRASFVAATLLGAGLTLLQKVLAVIVHESSTISVSLVPEKYPASSQWVRTQGDGYQRQRHEVVKIF